MDSFGGEQTHLHRSRSQRELDQRWAYGLGIAVLGVLLPVAAGFPDPRIRFGQFRGEMLVAIIAAVLSAAMLLCVAAAIRRSGRAGWFAAAVVVLILGHPILNASFGGEPRLLLIVRVGLVVAVIAIRCASLGPIGFLGRVVRDLAVLLALTAFVLEIIGSEAATWQPGARSLALAAAVLAVGSIDFIRGQRLTEGDVAAFGMSALSFGFGGLLLLASGGVQLTVGVATVSIVTAVCAVAASMIAVFEALAYREAVVETIRLSEALAVSTLNMQSNHHAQVAHDQRGALLAIEAAALRLRDFPSFDLAAAVAAEAGRLQRSLSDELATERMFNLRVVLEPMVSCIRVIGTDVQLLSSADVEAWGSPDDTVEIVRALVDNAISHGDGAVSIEVSQVGDMAVVCVADEGDGVPPALQESIFDRGVTTQPQHHSGLGLWAAREAALDMGGSLSAAAHRRSTFELRLRTTPAPTPVAAPAGNENSGHEPIHLFPIATARDV